MSVGRALPALTLAASPALAGAIAPVPDDGPVAGAPVILAQAQGAAETAAEPTEPTPRDIVRERFSQDFSLIDTLDPEIWRVADFTNESGWIDTAWSAENLTLQDGVITLELNGQDRDEKNFTGAEFKTAQHFHYGRYDVTMKPSDAEGALSAFFVYTGKFFDDPTSEVDIEFVGGDTTRVLLTIHTPLGNDATYVDLGFDAAEAEHVYSFDWNPDAVTWFVDGDPVHQIVESDIGLPAIPGQIFMSIWTGSSKFTGIAEDDVVAQAQFSKVAFTPRSTPTAFDDSAAVAPGGSVDIDVLANDETLFGQLMPGSVTLIEPPRNGTAEVDPQTGRITYRAADGYSGSDRFTYSVGNGVETSNSGRVEVAVGEVPPKDIETD